MKVTKEKAAENREALLRAAGDLFRERGIDGVGVAEICKRAGLTHGALYAQFKSKEALAAEALRDALQRNEAKTLAVLRQRPFSLGRLLDYLLSEEHRDDLKGCPLAASGSEIARQDRAVSASFTAGIERLTKAFEVMLGDTATRATARERALALVAAELGAIIVARGTAKAAPKLSSEILSASRKVLREIAGDRKGLRRSRRSKRTRA